MIIAQISDPHIDLETPENEIALQQAVTHLLQLPARPDVVLITGDCVNNGHVAEYERFQTLLGSLTIPVYIVPGNHDNRIHLQQVFGTQGVKSLEGFVQYVVDEYPVRLIALDTNVPGRNEGLLCAERLRWLDERLAEAQKRPTLLFMHHPPFATGLKVTDAMGLENADALGAIVARYQHIECVVAGHVHSTMLRRFYGTLAVICPPTSYSMFFDFSQPDKLAFVKQPPAYLLHIWHEDTGLVTHSSLIGNYGLPQLIHDGEKWIA
jgi:3',5'-cyclic-AMP phosphodiesterase